MTFSDLFAVRGIEQRSFADAWGLGALLGEFLNRRGYRLVARDRSSGRILGYAFGWRADVELHVSNVAVETSRRRAGIGGALLRALIELGRRAGCREAHLEHRSSNQAARRLYESHGFEACGLRRRYYRSNGEDAVLMRRDIA